MAISAVEIMAENIPLIITIHRTLHDRTSSRATHTWTHPLLHYFFDRSPPTPAAQDLPCPPGQPDLRCSLHPRCIPAASSLRVIRRGPCTFVDCVQRPGLAQLRNTAISRRHACLLVWAHVKTPVVPAIRQVTVLIRALSIHASADSPQQGNPAPFRHIGRLIAPLEALPTALFSSLIALELCILIPAQQVLLAPINARIPCCLL